jgi:hypothetical protein
MHAIILFLFALASCATLGPKDFEPLSKNRELLVSLEPVVDINSFEAAYSKGYTHKTDIQMKTANDFSSSLPTASSVFFNDKRIHDLISVFDTEVRKSIVIDSLDKYGYIKARIKKHDLSLTPESYLYMILSGGTLFVANILGMPGAKYQTILEVEVDILNKEKNVVKTYSAGCLGSGFAALYYGYEPNEAVRKGNLESFKECISKIKALIVSDVTEINKQLKLTGIISDKR